MQPSSIACSANHLQVAAESLPWAHKLRRAVASLLLFPFSKVFLPGLSFSFSISTPLSLFTPCIPLLQRLLGPFCKGHLVGKAFVAFVKGWHVTQGLSQKAADMNTCGWWEGGGGATKLENGSLGAWWNTVVTNNNRYHPATPRSTSSQKQSFCTGWLVCAWGFCAEATLKTCYPPLVKELLCDGCPLAIPFCKGSPFFKGVYVFTHTLQRWT